MQLKPFPLPYQAVVFRRSHQNLEKKTMTANHPTHGGSIQRFKRPDDAELRKPGGSILGYGRPEEGSDWSPSHNLELEPGYQISDSSASAAIWMHDSDDVEPLFPEPGEYTFGFYYGDQLAIKVDKPVGTDEIVLELLRSNRALADVMLSPDTPPSGDLPRTLTRLIDLYPESSYADYARFALARWHRTRAGATRHRLVPANDRQAIVALLKGIDDRIGYGVHAMILLHQTLKASKSPDADRVLERMDRLFPDSSDRWDYLVELMGTEWWTQHDPRVPTKIDDAVSSRFKATTVDRNVVTFEIRRHFPCDPAPGAR